MPLNVLACLASAMIVVAFGYVLFRWRRAPKVFNAMITIAIVTLMAGVLSGVWLVEVAREWLPRTVKSESARSGFNIPEPTNAARAAATSAANYPQGARMQNRARGASRSPELDNAPLLLRPGVADLRDGVTVKDLLDCISNGSRFPHLVKESDEGYGRWVARFESDKGEWFEVTLRLGTPTAVLESVQFGDGTSDDDWQDLLGIVRQMCPNLF